MNNLIRVLSVSLIVLLLAACAKQAPAPMRVANDASVQAIKPILSANNKFALGPHQGLLGVRQYYFACDSSLLPTYYYKALRAHATYLKQHPSAKIEVQGYTAAAGSREYNITKGQRRADAVSSYLRLQGVNAAQILKVSFGSEFDKAYMGSINTKNCRVDLIYTAA